MKKYKYIGLFKSAEGHTYELETQCNGFIQAFFLLTADAIRSGKHYQLSTIKDVEKESTVKVDDILKVGELLG